MEDNLPKHIGIILDGNRRWAKANGVSKYKAHTLGVQKIDSIADHASERGVKYLTVYAFSTENWSREKQEVNYLMKLVAKTLDEFLPKTIDRGAKIVVLGELSDKRIPKFVINAINHALELTKDNTNGVLAICFNYGGQLEIVHAVKDAIKSGIKPEELTIQNISEYLYEPSLPPIDLMIRPSGEKRLSNFMLWRNAYSEFVFVDKNWPDFTTEDLDSALEEYARRHRRFGGS